MPVLPPNHAERAERLSPAKRALLERWKASRSNNVSTHHTIPPRDANGPAPLTFAQQRLWFLDQLSPGSPQYNIATALRLGGALDARRLERSLRIIIGRHQALRTAFRIEREVPVQVVVPECRWDLKTIDLTSETEITREIRREEIAKREALTSFDLASPPLLRATLLKIAEQEHTLLLTVHHIIADGWSMAVLADEVAQCYQSLSAGREPELSPLPIQFSDYAVWQREQLSAHRLKELLAYWSGHLSGAAGYLELPHDFPRPATQTFCGSVQRRTISAEATKALREFSRGQNSTLFMTLLAAFQVVLARFSGQHDVCVGSPIANRTRPEVERLIGFFANTLVFRANVSANPSFSDFLAQVRRATLEGYAHQDLPLDRIVEHLQVERDPSRTPMFQVMFVLQNIPLAPREIDGLTVSDIRFDHAPVSSFDATLNIDERDDRLNVSFVYNTSLFEPDTAARVLASYEEVLRQIVTDPTQRVLELSIVPPRERHLLLRKWNSTESAPPPDKGIHELITGQAARTPDRVAVVDANVSITYQGLDARSNQWARYLQLRAIGTGSVIAICIDRSVDMIVALLAVLKAGAAYLPLDPEQPSRRISAMVEDAGAESILTTMAHAGRFTGTAASIVEVDRQRESLESHSASPIQPIAGPDDLAYIVYTSGSTGTPKGGEIEHSGLVNHACVLAERYGLVPGDGVLQFLSFGFDAAGEEVFPTLVSGATLHIHPTPRELIGADLLDWSRRYNVNVLHIPPPVWDSVRMAIDNLGADSAKHLKTVLTGGEGIARAKFESWQKLVGDRVTLLYAYGVSEATITSTLFTATDFEAPSATERVPIGRPIANQLVFVLDEFQQPVPIGVPGELYIGGTGVARGYRGRPELTREHFVNVEVDSQRHRLYRTGDLVRYLNDGNLEFLGRIDHQIKIRGSRIEPAEIESSISEHPAVNDVAIVAHENNTTGIRLVAYLAIDQEWSLQPETMRTFLASRLPNPMIPSEFVVLDELPRGSTGKIDLSALPDPPAIGHDITRPFRAPASRNERALINAWESVLGQTPIGVDDNFFALGGDSIQTIQVVAKASDAGLCVTPRQMFEHQTIAELARVVEPITESRVDQGPVTGQVILTPIQHAFFDENFFNPNHFNQAVLLELDSAVSHETIAKAAEQLVTRHDMLRGRFQRDATGMWQQRILPPTKPCVERVDLSHTSPGDLAKTIEQAAAQWQDSLDITAGPLVRFVYCACGEAHCPRLLMVAHHLVIDAVSWRIVLNDLAILCRQYVNGTQAVLPPKTTSFQTWAEELRHYASTGEASQAVAFWKSQSPAIASGVGTDSANSRNTYAAAKTVQRQLTIDETRRFVHQATKAYRTSPAELLLTAVAKTTAPAGTHSVSIAMEGHGREELFDDVDLSHTVGWFTSLYPLVFQTPLSRDFEAWIIAIKEQSRAVPRHGIGHGVRRWLTGENVRSELVAFGKPKIAFNYLGSFDQLLPKDSLIRPAKEPVGPLCDPRNVRPHRWEIIAYIRDGQLCIEWTFSEALDDRQAMESKADRLIDGLRLLCEYCLKETTGRATPSDFPLAAADQQELDRVAELLQLGETRSVAPTCSPSTRHVSMKNVDDLYTLTPVQQSMLAHAQSGGDATTLIEQLSCTIEGPLNVDRFKRAWRTTIARHGVLRTCFVWDDLKEPLQVVRGEVECPWKVDDLRTLSSKDRSLRYDAIRRSERHRGFDPSRAPLMRLRLLRTQDQQWRLLWTCHHLILDGLSVPLIFRDALTAYAAQCETGVDAVGGESGATISSQGRFSFRNYITWLNKREDSRSEVLWQKTLADLPNLTRLPIARPLQPFAVRHESQIASQTLTRDESQRLRDVAAELKVSVNAVVQGAWALLLARYTGESDVLFGVGMSGRPDDMRGSSEMVGPMSGIVPFRVQAINDVECATWLQQLHATQNDLRQHQYTPLEAIAQSAGLPEGRRLFETLLVFESHAATIADPLPLGDISIREIQGTASSAYPMTVVVLPTSAIELRAMFDPMVFDLPVIEQLLNHLSTLLNGIATNPYARLEELCLLSRREQVEILEIVSRKPRPLVLDIAGQIAPVDVPGRLYRVEPLPELCETVGRDPSGECLAEKLFGSDAMLQLIATGQRAVRRIHGKIEPLGSFDAPLRIGHYGVDPVLVETALGKHRLVADVAVVGQPNRQGETQLAAFIVPARETRLAIAGETGSLVVSQLRNEVASSLAPPLVPRLWCVVDKIPRRPDGSIEIGALPEASQPRDPVLGDYVPPRNEIEETLAGIWSEILGVAPIGIDDSFLELGGDSMSAVTLLSRLETDFNRKVPLVSLF